MLRKIFQRLRLGLDLLVCGRLVDGVRAGSRVRDWGLGLRHGCVGAVAAGPLLGMEGGFWGGDGRRRGAAGLQEEQRWEEAGPSLRSG